MDSIDQYNEMVEEDEEFERAQMESEKCLNCGYVRDYHPNTWCLKFRGDND